MCTDPYQWWAMCIRSDKYTDHRMSVNLHDHPAADGSVVDDEWCVLVRWTRVNADHWTRAFCAYRDQRGSEYACIDVYSERRVPFEWSREGGSGVASQASQGLETLTASKNGKWIAAGTSSRIFVWNTETYEEVIKHRVGNYVRGIDFSPDSTRLAVGTDNKTAIVWDLATGKQVQTLDHQDDVGGAKYHQQIHLSLGQQRWPLACRHQRKSNPVVQHWSPLVQRPPLCHRPHTFHSLSRVPIWRRWWLGCAPRRLVSPQP